jgi:plastocyanin
MWAQFSRQSRVGLVAWNIPFWGLVGAIALLLAVTQVVAWPAERPLQGAVPVLNPVTPPLGPVSDRALTEVVIGMAGQQFLPPYVVVQPGTTVRWYNDDATFHQVVADDGSWTSPVLSPGDSFSRTFSTPGVFPYHCVFFPEMHGVVTVGEHGDLPWMLRNARFPTAVPTATRTPTPGPTATVIGPAGGSLNAPDGSAQIGVPPGAVDQDTLFSYAPTSPAPPPEYQDAGNAFDLRAQVQGTPVAQFRKPLDLVVHYDGDDVADDSNGLGLFYQPGGSDTWEELESEIDVQAQVVTAETDHLTLFALLRRVLPQIFWKAPWRDYAPSGMPDFDQKQDGWRNTAGQWTHCGPVAVANSLWWFDSQFEPNPIPPPAINDNYPLLQSYNPGVWDDHDPRNVQPFVNNLAGLAGTGATGTTPNQLAQAIQAYLAAKGLGGQYTVTLRQRPPFPWVEEEIERSEDVILLIGFWQETTAGWRRIGGHYVTAAGVDSPRRLIAFSDPFADAAEVGGWGRVLPGPHPPAHGAGLHNDARFVSHDLYRVIDTRSPGGIWGLWGYARWLDLANFKALNTPDELRPFQGSYTKRTLKFQTPPSSEL